MRRPTDDRRAKTHSSGGMSQCACSLARAMLKPQDSLKANHSSSDNPLSLQSLVIRTSIMFVSDRCSTAAIILSRSLTFKLL